MFDTWYLLNSVLNNKSWNCSLFNN